MNEPVFKSGVYDTSYIPRYKIMEKVVDYVGAQKAARGTVKIAAAVAAVGAYVNGYLGQQ